MAVCLYTGVVSSRLVNFRVDEGLLGEARAAAAEAGLSLSAVLREALVSFVAERRGDVGSAARVKTTPVVKKPACPACGSNGRLRFGGRWCDEHGRF